jgi:hypothetical protein
MPDQPGPVRHETPSRPRTAPPPAKDRNRPRPYASVPTDALIEQTTDISQRIQTAEEQAKRLKEERIELWRELERREISYRQMEEFSGVSNVAISRMLRRREGQHIKPAV